MPASLSARRLSGCSTSTSLATQLVLDWSGL
jgi:hypothetical protein